MPSSDVPAGSRPESELFERLIEDVKRNGTREQQRSVLDRLRRLIDSHEVGGEGVFYLFRRRTSLLIDF